MHAYLLKYLSFELIPEVMLYTFFQLDIIHEKNMSSISGGAVSACFQNKNILSVYTIAPSVLQPSNTYVPQLRSQSLRAKQCKTSLFKKLKLKLQVTKDLQTRSLGQA